MFELDAIDKQILIELDGNCRLTFQTIADNLGLTRSAIKRRVDKLVKLGVIERFSIELSRKMVNCEWMSVELTTTGNEDVRKFIERINKHPMTFVTAWLRNEKYLIYCHVDSQYGSYEIGKFLRSQKEVTSAELQPMLPVTNQILSSRSWFQSSGEAIQLTNGQLRLLQSLLDDARIPISAISAKTGMSSKRIRVLLDELQTSGAVHFTIKFNFSARGNTNFILKLKFNESSFKPKDIVKWIQKRHSHEYWNSFLIVSEPTLLNFFTCSNLKDVERITLDAKNASFTISAEPMILYPCHASRSLGRVRLEELLSGMR